MIKKFLFLIFALVVVAGAYWFYTNKASRADETTELAASSTVQTPKIRLFDIQKKEGDKTTPYLIDITYPKIVGLPDAAGKESNQLIEEFITTNTDKFKKNVAEFAQGEDLPKSELHIDYKLTALNDKIVTMEFSVSEYMSGAAHPNGFVHSFNYNVRELRPVKTLKEFFSQGANYLPIVSELSRVDLKDQLKEYGGMEKDIETGTEPKEENFQTFVLTTHGLKLIFNPYQIGPYALGVQEVLIPYEKLKDLLPADSFFLNFK